MLAEAVVCPPRTVLCTILHHYSALHLDSTYLAHLDMLVSCIFMHFTACKHYIPKQLICSAQFPFTKLSIVPVMKCSTQTLLFHFHWMI